METNKKIFLLQPFNHKFHEVHELIQEASAQVGATLWRLDEIAIAGSITEVLYEGINDADLIICDITNANSNILYELGYSHGLRKPVILISQHPEQVPFDIRSVRVIYYDLSLTRSREFVRELQQVITRALQNPEGFNYLPRTEKSVSNVFISYSHRDTEYLTRLLVHLRPLEKQGFIDLWVDTKLEAGDQWKPMIEEALKRSRVAILLLSADFLASDFIVENELPPLLAQAESEGARIIPVIVKPCRFKRDISLSRFQTINDPAAPLSMLPEAEQERIYDRIAEAVEKAMVK